MKNGNLLPDIRAERDRGLNFSKTYHSVLSRLSDERYGRIVRAMCEFEFEGKRPKFETDDDKSIWELIELTLRQR